MPGLPLEDVKRLTYKAQDSWWTVILVDPLAVRLVRFVGGMKAVTPNRLTAAAFLLGLVAAACFLQATRGWLILGACVFHLSFVFDCIDGKLARLRGTSSVFGGWLDYILDRARVLVCAAALMGGQYLHTGKGLFLLLGIGVVFLDMFRYLNALQISKTRGEMQSTLGIAKGEGAPAAGDPQDMFQARFGRFNRYQGLLGRYRIRPHMMSGIEFQMAVFIVGPLTMLIIPVTAIAGVLLLAFEIGIIYKFWLSTKDFTQELDKLTTAGIASTSG